MQRSRSEYSIINILTGFGGYFLNTIMGYICRMVFVRCLSAEYLGVNGLFTNILSMLSLAELGIGGESESSSEETTAPEVEETEETPEENNLPSPADLGQDFSDNTQF